MHQFCTNQCLFCNAERDGSDDGACAFLSEPLLGFVGGDSLELSELSSLVLLLGHSLARPTQNDVEVHSKYTRVRVVLDAQVDVLLNSETKVAFLKTI